MAKSRNKTGDCKTNAKPTKGILTGIVKNQKSQIKRVPKDLQKAIHWYEEAIRLDPDVSDPSKSDWYAKRADAYSKQGNNSPVSALQSYWKASRYNGEGEYQAAIACYEDAIQADPQFAWAPNNLAWLLATCSSAKVRNGRAAVKQAIRACELSNWKSWCFFDTLAASYAEAGDFAKAIASEESAATMAPLEEQDERKEMLKLFKAGKPWRERQRMILDYGSELPIFKKLGRRFFVDKTTEQFWQILIMAAAGDWRYLQEYLEGDLWGQVDHDLIPAGFRKLHHKRLVLWTAFSVCNYPCMWSVGVIRHRDVPFCHPVIYEDHGGGEFFVIVGPQLKKRFSPRLAAQAAFEIYEANCCEHGNGSLPYEFTNHVPQYVSRSQLEEMYRRYWGTSSGSFDEAIKQSRYEE